VRLHELEKKAREVGRLIGDQCPEGVGFCLMMFTFGEDGWSTYLSNAEPESMIEAIRELADKRERQLRETGK
jgi:nitrogen regulatory protein PII-like uncharacterized protein